MKTNRFLGILITLGMILAILPITECAAKTITPVTPPVVTASTYKELGFSDSEWKNFDGYYAIHSVEEMEGYRNVINTKKTAVNAILRRNLDFSGYTWTPIRNNYGGVFDGNMCYIYKMQNDLSNDTAEDVGLFGYAYNMTIKNVYLRATTFSGVSCVGSVVGFAEKSTIKSCYANSACTVTSKNPKSGSAQPANAVFVGGIAGRMMNSTADNCTYQGKVEALNTRTTCGLIAGEVTGTVSNCTYAKLQKSYCMSSAGTGVEEFFFSIGTENYSGSTATDPFAERIVDINDVLNHTHRYLNRTALLPKCGENGYTSLQHCLICNDIKIPETIYNNHEYSSACDIDCNKCLAKRDPGEVDENAHSITDGICGNCGMYETPKLINNTYQISNAGNLFWFAKQVNEVGNREINGVLTDDIDLKDRPWTPIGTTGENNNNFRGVFDGQGHTITGLHVTGERNGVGFFGEVRTGTVKNFTIYGKVTVPKTCTYVGGVIGSACGVNKENDLARNGAIIQNITSFVHVTTTAHGIGRIGGFMGYANHETLVENCAWYGTLDLGEYRAEAGVGGFIGRIQENSNAIIRNSAAYGTIHTNYKKGAYNNSNDIFIGGFTGWSVQGTETRPTNTVIENCLFAGSIVLGKDITDMIDYSAFGCLAQIKSITNCYYLGETGLPGINLNSTYKPTEAELVSVDRSQLASGEVSYLLGDAFGQKVGTDELPILGKDKVYKYIDGYSNAFRFGFVDYTTESVTINIPEAGTYSLVFADYDGARLYQIKIVPVSAEAIGEITQEIEGVSLNTEDKIMLWQDTTTLVPLCDAYIVK